MNSKEHNDFLMHSYLDGELNEEEKREFEEFLETSPETREEINSIKNLGDTLRTAMKDEVEKVDFRNVWTNVDAAIQEKKAGSLGIIDFLTEFFTPRRMVASVAAALMIFLGVVFVWKLSIAPTQLEAAPASVESIEVLDVDIVVSFDNLEDSMTTVVWIDGLEIDEEEVIEK